MTFWHRLTDVVVGSGLGPRDAAARLLTALLGLAVIMVVASGMVNAFRAEDGLDDGISQLLIGVLTLMVGTVSGYLARRQEATEDPDETTRAPVGTILAAVLGFAVVVVAGTSLVDAIWSREPGISSNMATLLSAVMGGTLGAIAAYLGLPQANQGRSPSRLPEGTAGPLPESSSPGDAGGSPAPEVPRSPGLG